MQLKHKLPIFLLLITLSCGNKHDPKEFERILNSSQFDTHIIKNAHLFDSAYNIIIQHLDTLLVYQKSDVKMETLTSSLPEKFDNGYRVHFRISPELEEHDSVVVKSFYPANIYPKLFHVFDQIGRENVETFFVAKDSNVLFYLKGRVHRAEYLEELHRLDWKSKFTKRIYQPTTDTIFKFRKDSVISKNWVYNIILDPYLGM